MTSPLPSVDMSRLDPGVPLLLLPVRLETRFRPATAAGAVPILVRVYPDTVHLDGHERGLVADEIRAGEHYWRTTLQATGQDERDAAWKQLTDRTGPRRAAWIATALTPLTIGPDPTFPAPAEQASRWSRAAVAEALPDRWVALAYRDGIRIATATGTAITRPLAAGPSPVDSGEPADPAMRWMVDFGAAERAGMGLTLHVPAHLADRIDLLLVTGVRENGDPAGGGTTLTGLLDAHRYHWGLDLLATGTPTNNTTDQRAAATVTGPPTGIVPDPGSDAGLLARALGVRGGALADLTDLHRQRDATDMSTLLWPATWGYFLTQIMAPRFGDTDLTGWRQWVTTTVRGSGPLPALRAGDQPYGVLPATSLDRWRPAVPAPDLLLLDSADDGGPRTGLRVLWDLDANHTWTAQTPPAVVPLPAGAYGTGLALADLDGDGRLQAVTGWLTTDGRQAGFTVLALGDSGTVTGQAGAGSLPVGVPASALALAVNRNEIAVGWQDARTRPPQRTTRLVVGSGLSADGTVGRWGTVTTLTTVGPDEKLLGLASGPGTFYLLTAVGGRLQYRTGSRKRADVIWSAPMTIVSGTVDILTGGITVAGDDGRLIVRYGWDGGGAYTIGQETAWTFVGNTGTTPPGRALAGGLAIGNLGRATGAGWHSSAARIDLLRQARDRWLTAASLVPRADTSAGLLELLATDAVSASLAVRPAIGPVYARNLWFAMNQALTDYTGSLAQRLQPALTPWDVDTSARIASLAFTAQAEPVDDPDTPLDLAALVKATPRELHDNWWDARTPVPTRLIRHALLQAYADAAFLLVPVTDVPLPEPELVDLADVTAPDPVTPKTLTSWRHLDQARFQGRPVADVLHELARKPQPPAEVQPLAESLAALERLATLPDATVRRLFTETLDLSSHRLDAWITAVAVQRLTELRDARPDGVQLGGYGLVTDLHPATRPPTTGYVHAPSIGQAATAAVLRSGHLSHPDGSLAVDLGSARARLALDLLDGVRSGQTLGALLGHLLERELTGRGLARYLPALRRIAPEAAGPDTGPFATVDGLALLRLPAVPWGGDLPEEGKADQLAIAAAIAVVADAVDAVGDVGLAESVHQALMGNHVRSGATLDALSRGELPPPEPDVLRSPRTGVAQTHRIVLLIGDDLATPHWRGTKEQRELWSRARAEPRLNAWAAAVLGDPARVRLRVGDKVHTLDAAGLCPLDLLYGPSPSVATLSETDLGRRIAANLGTGTLDTGRADDWPPDVLSLDELLTLAEVARDVVRGSRAADARDLGPAGRATDPGLIPDERLAEATDRLTAAIEALCEPFGLTATDLTALGTAFGAANLPGGLANLLDLPAHLDIGLACGILDRPAPDGIEAVSAALTVISTFGVDGAAPPPGADRAGLAVQARTVSAAARARLDTARDGTGTARLEALFGPGFRVLPLFDAGDPRDLTAPGEHDLRDWLDGVAEVRPGAARLADLRLLSTGTGEFTALQLPVGDDEWIGAAGVTPLGGRTGIVVAGPIAPGELAGLMIDEWVEVLPGESETTGVVFHFDSPGATAPQALLLAVAPDPAAPWTLGTLESVLLETYDTTRIRTVRPGQAAGLGHLLPALMFARNVGGDPAGDTIATRFGS
ncbi:hypothetical protein [Actinoplanes subglobosus]|uniref:Uncharacterized protein n=1 Tax=Actinoplanes subglobosus TaxID=1547892 RepID=A0ABV8IU00_9ACTN